MIVRWWEVAIPSQTATGVTTTFQYQFSEDPAVDQSRQAYVIQSLVFRFTTGALSTPQATLELRSRDGSRTRWKVRDELVLVGGSQHDVTFSPQLGARVASSDALIRAIPCPEAVRAGDTLLLVFNDTVAGDVLDSGLLTFGQAFADFMDKR